VLLVIMMTKKLGLCRLSVALLVLAAIVVFPAGMALAYPQANPSRVLPGSVQRGETFNVTVNFTAPADNFFLVSISDLAPAGWNVTANATWCTPVATSVTAAGNEAQIAWGESFSNGTFFTAVYEVAVPENAAEGFYTFTGFLQYYFGDEGPYRENITGDSQVFFPPELEGHVSFSGRDAAPNDKWIEAFEVKGFESGNLSHVLWTTNATTNNTGVFTVNGLTPGTYDIAIKNWTCLSELVTNVTLSAGVTTVVDFGYTREGDVNNDDWITGADRSILYTDWGKTVPPGTAYADFNRDGWLTGADRSLMYTCWSQHGDLI
jgi:hypothetical protein